MACRRDNVSVLSNDLAATVLPGVGPFRHFRFLAPSTRLNAISEISAIVGRRRVVRRADFGELNTQKLILCELPKNVHANLGAKIAPPGANQEANVFSATGH